MSIPFCQKVRKEESRPIREEVGMQGKRKINMWENRQIYTFFEIV